MVRFLFLVIGVMTGVSAFVFLRAEEWTGAAALGAVALVAFVLAAVAHRSSSVDTSPREGGLPSEDGTPHASSTPPPASTA